LLRVSAATPTAPSFFRLFMTSIDPSGSTGTLTVDGRAGRGAGPK
jgi:hypothetical protein